jgi:hypothetical protein
MQNLKKDYSINQETSFYNKYFLSNPLNNQQLLTDKHYSIASDKQAKNILKDEFTLNYSDYEKLKLADQYNRLYVDSLSATQEKERMQENKKFYNMSLKLLIKNASDVYIQLINELSNFVTKNDQKSLNQLGYILTKGENMLYIGLLLIVIAFSMWLIEITS